MRPRHYVLIGLLLLLLVINLFRNRKRHAVDNDNVTVNLAQPGDNPDTAAVWPAFDSAAKLRDADDAQFQPALASLKGAIASVHDPNLKVNADVIADVHGCMTWLMFYRQGVNHHAAADDAWQLRSRKHLDNCVAQHRDVSQ